VFGSLIQRMILWELLKVFVVSLVAITGLLLLAGLFTEATQRGLEPGQILSIIPLLIPSTLPYTLPATTLFATCVVYGRLAADNEILALKAAGINILRVVSPGVLLGLTMSAVTAYLYYDAIPTTHFMLRSRVMADIEDYMYSLLRKHGSIQHPKLNYVMFVERVDGRKLLGAHFMRRDGKGGFDIRAHAREAELRVNRVKRQIIVRMVDCRIIGETDGDGANVRDQQWPVDLPPDFDEYKKTRENDMTWDELFDYRDELREEISKIDREIELHQAEINMKRAPDHFTGHVQRLRESKRRREILIHSAQCEMLMRPALAMGCLCFVLVGCPVGIWFSRSDYLSAFITCFLPIVFVYYPLLLFGMNLARTGHLPPPIAIWSANALIGGCALGLFRKLMKH
jgi:lipopolysaccharide export system permease protein